MADLQNLINVEDPFSPHLNEWVALAKNKVEVLPCDPLRAKETLLQTQVSIHSALGAVVYETGGILIDDGWIRILGSGCDKFNRTVSEWNRGKTFSQYGEIPQYLLIADDAIGGFFAINGGLLGKDVGNVYYYSPDLLEWLPFEIAYPDFLLFCFESNLDDFYAELRWHGWQNDVKKLCPDHAYSFSPFLWTAEAGDINNIKREVLPVSQVYDFNLGLSNITQ